MMKSYIVFSFLSLAIFLTFFQPALVSGEIQFCPGTFKADETCDKIRCGYLALFKWPASKMPQNCKCAPAGKNHSTCTCMIVCDAKL
ncbi:hypothetical protein H5410_038276 [Solanum commersonii]|uniref:Uncharacterized protein n=3 Tax=Solanum TaxID=4107 RepID=A0ABQ7UCD4_SOLTU|nr:hypothetical protein H5410_038276 [Solanum commersonii]KAH0653639.1 hypothetical protein KY289_031317 [Solanum tuberosum]KAH0656303.1 hypothetical protein KY285_031185 [Solanum tuberosum]KAH0743913.1 hypothetical protein KY290_031906 [Solanum tuberosum]